MITSLTNVSSYIAEVEVVSFDLFDTLIYRNKIALSDVLRISALNIISYLDDPQLSVGEILSKRREITQMLKESCEYNSEEPYLGEIFKKILLAYGVEEKHVHEISQVCVDYELALDQKSLSCVSGAKDLLQKVAKSGKKIIAVSDMYYTADEISDLLASLGISDYFDEIIVSASEGKAKYSSNLFDVVLEKIDVPANRVLHVGDNINNDIRMAKKAGLNSLRILHEDQIAFENNPTMLKESAEDVVDVLLDSVVTFIHNLVLDCRKNNIKRIYCLTRDADVFRYIASSLQQKSSFFASICAELVFKELHLSRTTTAFLSINNINPVQDILGKMLWLSHGKFSLKELFILLSWNDSLDYIGKNSPNGFAEKIWDKNNINELEEFLIQVCPESGDCVIKDALSHANKTIKYLKQEKVLGDGRIAFVDLGYTSTATREIAHFLLKSKSCDKYIPSTSIIDYLYIEGPQKMVNFHSSFSVSRIRTTPLISWGRIPDVLKGNFSWIECFFANKSRGGLFCYEDNSDGLQGRFVPGISGFENILIKRFNHRLDELVMRVENCVYLSQKVENAIVENVIAEFVDPCNKTLEIVSGLHQGVSAIENNSRSVINYSITLRDFAPHVYKNNLLKDMWYVGSIKASGRKYMFVLLHFMKTAQKFVRKIGFLKAKSKPLLKKLLR